VSLRRQLTLVSLLLLTLPWAGCQFVREIEDTLRQGQAQALQDTAQSIAASFSNKTDLLYPYPERLTEPAEPARSLYAHVATGPIIVDGYADGWPGDWSGEFSNSLNNITAAFRYQAATRHGQLYLLLQVEDSEVVYDNPGLSPEPNGDHLLVRTWFGGKRQEYVIATAAPGSVRARSAGPRHPEAQAGRIRGFWQDTSSGYMLELQLPLAITGGRLGLQLINIDPDQRSQPVTAGNMAPMDQAAPPWLVFSPAPLGKALEAFQLPGRSVGVYDKTGWQVGATEPPHNRDTYSTETSSTFWLLRALYRRILAHHDNTALPRIAADGRLQAPELTRALEGNQESHWYREAFDSRRATLSAGAPVRHAGTVVGGVVVRQSSEEYLSLTDQAFSRLLGYSLVAIGVAALGLLAYASILSWRIGRLSRAASRVVQNGNIVMDDFPHSRARDEVGELSRRYARLLAELQGYNEYLRTLSRKLSHELRTPVAVIQSSLDNLEHELAGDQSQTYIGRAPEGLSRLNRILTAMTEASHVEESVRGDPLLLMDLVPLLEQVLPAYRDAYPGNAIRLDLEVTQAWCFATPDLLIQALDKLVDNAASFAPPGGDIVIGLAVAEKKWSLTVTNAGPPLPVSMQGQLFEAMVSLRESTRQPSEAQHGVHLGLGLYIVKLIVEYLGGDVRAENLPSDRGVVIRLGLPRETGPGDQPRSSLPPRNTPS